MFVAKKTDEGLDELRGDAVGDRALGQVDPVPGHGHPARAKAGGQLEHQAALADAGLSLDHDRDGLPGSCTLCRGPQRSELAGSTDEDAPEPSRHGAMVADPGAVVPLRDCE